MIKPSFVDHPSCGPQHGAADQAERPQVRDSNVFVMQSICGLCFCEAGIEGRLKIRRYTRPKVCFDVDDQLLARGILTRRRGQTAETELGQFSKREVEDVESGND